MSQVKPLTSTDRWKIAFSVIAIIMIVLVVAEIGSWAYGWQEKWRDTGTITSVTKQLDYSQGSVCCNFVHNITIITDHHGQLIWRDNEDCLGDVLSSGFKWSVNMTVAIKYCNNGLAEVHADP